MSWDVFIFKANRTINNIDDLEEDTLVNIGTWQEFKNLLVAQFPQASFDSNWCTIEIECASLETSLGPLQEQMSNTIFHLYGAESIYLLLALCQQNSWQAFDTSLGSMLHLARPEQNGYLDFIAYLTLIEQSR